MILILLRTQQDDIFHPGTVSEDWNSDPDSIQKRFLEEHGNFEVLIVMDDTRSRPQHEIPGFHAHLDRFRDQT
jgi:hypothetical protein